MKKFIGIDIGGTNTRVALIDGDLNIINRVDFLTHSFKSSDEFLTTIYSAIKKLDINNEVGKIGIILPAPYYPNCDKIADISNVPMLENLKINDLKLYFPDYEITLENDVNAITILESELGAAKNYKNTIYVTFSTGIAAGIILNNTLLHGSHGFAGEIGGIYAYPHIDCTFEKMCGGKALDYSANEIYGNDTTGSHFFAANDIEANKKIEKWIEHVSYNMASIIHCFDPEIIVLGGAIILNNEWIIDDIYVQTNNKLFESLQNKIKMVLPYFGKDVGVLSAAYIIKKLED